MSAITGDNGLPGWEPRELGLPRATLIAILLAAAITLICVWISAPFGQKPAQVTQAVQVTLTQLPQPAPAPPPTPKVTPPKPVPDVIPKPPPVPSRIAVATKPPPVRHISKPAPHPVIRHMPTPVRRPAPVSNAPPQAQARAVSPMAHAPAATPAPTSGIPSYGEQIYTIIQANQNVPFVLSQMGASGTAVIEIEVAPDGRVISARVYKSSGIPLIDTTALDHARGARLPPFNTQMPNQPHIFLVPIAIQPSTNE